MHVTCRFLYDEYDPVDQLPLPEPIKEYIDFTRSDLITQGVDVLHNTCDCDPWTYYEDEDTLSIVHSLQSGYINVHPDIRRLILHKQYEALANPDCESDSDEELSVYKEDNYSCINNIEWKKDMIVLGIIHPHFQNCVLQFQEIDEYFVLEYPMLSLTSVLAYMVMIGEQFPEATLWSYAGALSSLSLYRDLKDLLHIIPDSCLSASSLFFDEHGMYRCISDGQ